MKTGGETSSPQSVVPRSSRAVSPGTWLPRNENSPSCSGHLIPESETLGMGLQSVATDPPSDSDVCDQVWKECLETSVSFFSSTTF